MEIVTSWMEQGIERGMEQGRQQEARNLVLRQLRKRFASLDEEVQRTIGTLSVGQLEELGEALLDFTSAADLTEWLNQRDGERAEEPRKG